MSNSDEPADESDSREGDFEVRYYDTLYQMWFCEGFYHEQDNAIIAAELLRDEGRKAKVIRHSESAQTTIFSTEDN